MLTVLLDTSTFKKVKPSVIKDEPMLSYKEDAMRIMQYCENGSRIFIVANSNSDYQYFVGYYANELVMDFRAATNMIDLDYDDEGVRTFVETAISENDYVYVKEINDSFNKNLSKMLESGNFEEETVYKVVHDRQTTLLVPVTMINRTIFWYKAWNNG